MRNITLDFETAMDILKNIYFDDEDKFVGAAIFVAEAFDMSVDSVLEEMYEQREAFMR